jgi:hypothetical protein
MQNFKIRDSRVQFGSIVLPVILSTWICFEAVKEVFEIISPNKEANEDYTSLFNAFLKITPLLVMPRTSNHPRKLKNNTNQIIKNILFPLLIIKNSL